MCRGRLTRQWSRRCTLWSVASRVLRLRFGTPFPGDRGRAHGANLALPRISNSLAAKTAAKSAEDVGNAFSGYLFRKSLRVTCCRRQSRRRPSTGHELCVWHIFDPAVPLDAGAVAWLQAAQAEAALGYPGVPFNHVFIITPVDQYDPNLNDPQEFLTIDPKMQGASEPVHCCCWVRGWLGCGSASC
jgi:hypothetical protein